MHTNSFGAGFIMEEGEGEDYVPVHVVRSDVSGGQRHPFPIDPFLGKHRRRTLARTARSCVDVIPYGVSTVSVRGVAGTIVRSSATRS